MSGGAPSVEIIYEDDELRVIHQAGGGSMLLITFADLVTLADGLRFFAAVPAAKAGLPAIGFVAKQPNWYPVRNVHAAINAIADQIASYATRVVYGGSMGGYAALKFSRLLQATQVISLCPQWSINPEECGGRESGWSNFFTPQMACMGIRGSDVAGRAFVFSDLGDPVDRFHCSHIQAAAPQADIINVPMIGHYVTAVFAGTDNLRELIQASVDDDVARARRFARRIRRAHPIRFELLLARAYPRHPQLCGSLLLAMARERPQVLSADPRFLHDALAQTAQTAGPESVLELFNHVQATVSTPAGQLRAAVIAARQLDVEAFVSTHHDTRVVYDFAMDACRHVERLDPVAEAPVRIALSGARASLSVQGAGMRMCLRPDGRGRLGCAGEVADEDALQAFTIEPAPGGQFQLSWNGLYLSAEPSGRLVCNRPAASGWEQFRFNVSRLTPVMPDA